MKLKKAVLMNTSAIRVLRDHLFCSRPRPRLVLISILFQDQYQDKSWNETFFETNTKRCLDFSFLSRPIPRLVLILETIQDQYQESWLWTCSRPIPMPIPIPGSLNQWVYRNKNDKARIFRNFLEYYRTRGFMHYTGICLTILINKGVYNTM